MAELPEKVDLGAVIYAIEVVPKLVDASDKKRLLGEIKHSLSRIFIDADAEIQAMAGTLLHEIFHYIIVENGQDGAIVPERTEEFITTMATGTLLLIRKNPDLIKFIQELDNA